MANQQLLDALIEHRVGVERYSKQLTRDLIKLLSAAEDDVSTQILKRFERIGVEDHTGVRLKELLTRIRAINTEAHARIDGSLFNALDELAANETIFAQSLYGLSFAAREDIRILGNEQLKAILRTKPLNGRFLKDWTQYLDQASYATIEQQIRIGMAEGEGTEQIIRRLVGTRTNAFGDGAYTVTRRRAEMVVRTSVNHVSNAAHYETIRENPDLFPQYAWLSILDNRTTPICRQRAGKVYRAGKGPVPPAHPSCRSTIVAVDPGDEDETPVPTYSEWMDRQPAAVQKDVLGPTRYRLWKKGGLELDRFTNRRGDQITLEGLKKRDADAFRRAGLKTKSDP